VRTDLAEEDFVGEGAVHVGGVEEEGDPAAERLRDDGDAGLVVQRGVVRARQSHTPEPQLGHLESLGAELDAGNRRGLVIHGRCPPVN